jgi:hypothetical protein
MYVSPQNPRSILTALFLLNGWLTIILGTFILIAGSKEDAGTAFNFLATGTAVVGLIYYRERFQKAE